MPPSETDSSPGVARRDSEQGAGARAGRVALSAAVSLIETHDVDVAEALARSLVAMLAFGADRRISSANRFAEDLFGYEPGALAGVSTDALIPARLRHPQAPPMLAAEDVMQVELPGVRRDGLELALTWMFRSVRHASGSCFVMCVEDRASVDRGVDTLRASEERFRLLVESVQEYAMYVLDPTGHVSSWNRGAERLKGWKANEIIGEPYARFFTPADRDAGVPQELLAAALRDGSHEVTGWRVRKDGSRFRVSARLTALRDPTGQLRGFAKITRDLTEKVRVEELERLTRLQTVTAALSEAATPRDVAQVVLENLRTFDAHGGSVYGLVADGRTLALLDRCGYPSPLMTPYTSFSLDESSPVTDVARSKRPAFYESLDECLRAYPSQRDALVWGGFEALVALPLVTHGEVLGALALRFRERRTFDEGDRSMLLTLSNLAAQALERARLLAAEKQARADAEAANRAKDEFLAMLGHELRNPLAPIVTALQLLKLKGKESSEELTVIGRHVTHLGHLVDDLLDVSRITRGLVELRREPVELASVIARAVELSSSLLEENRHHLRVSVPTPGLVVYGDPTRLSQVFANLVSNAAKYTPPGGHIEIGATKDGERIVTIIRDDGVGIAASVLPRVFEMFVQEEQMSDRAAGGLGLGLAIVKTFVAMHEGTVHAASEGRGKGSTFTVDLPASSRSVGARPPAIDASAATRAGVGPRVLVVDDNHDAATMMQEWLAETGCDVRTAHDGPAALEAVVSFRPDVVLLDIGLPVMDGLEVARQIRARAGAEPMPLLVAVTGYGQPRDRARTAEAGFDAHMVKPIDLEALTALLTSPRRERGRG